jgi:hypothetical protein
MRTKHVDPAKVAGYLAALQQDPNNIFDIEHQIGESTTLRDALYRAHNGPLFFWYSPQNFIMPKRFECWVDAHRKAWADISSIAQVDAIRQGTPKGRTVTATGKPLSGLWSSNDVLNLLAPHLPIGNDLRVETGKTANQKLTCAVYGPGTREPDGLMCSTTRSMWDTIVEVESGYGDKAFGRNLFKAFL